MLTGKVLRRERENAGLSQIELAKLSGVGRGTINQFEMEKISPNSATLEKLEAVLFKNEIRPDLEDEAFLLLSHELGSLSGLLRDPSISNETKDQKFRAFIQFYVDHS